MNLSAIAGPIVAAVNPRQQLVVQVSLGEVTNSAFKPVPSYGPPVIVQGDVQPLQFRDIQMLDGLNLQGTQRKIYLFGRVDGLVRVDRKGGDLITDEAGNVWLVTLVLEQWPNWCSVAVTLQDGE